MERSQRTDLDEFYSGIGHKDPDLQSKLEAWENYYNHKRAHSSLNNKTPYERYNELLSAIPSFDQVYAIYDKLKERIALQNYKYDHALKLLGK